MSVIDHQRVYDSLYAVLEFFGEQLLKDIYTVMPGIIEQYDGVTRRAKVRGALPILMSDGTLMPRPPIVNVPVLFPFGGKYSLYFPLEEGDVVLIAYSMRGITEFKKTFVDAPPTESSLLDERDAIVIPGFGSLEISPVDEDGVSLQDRDGENYIAIKDGDVKIRSEDSIVVESDGDVTVEAGGTLNIESSGTVNISGSTIHFSGNVTGLPTP